MFSFLRNFLRNSRNAKSFLVDKKMKEFIEQYHKTFLPDSYKKIMELSAEYYKVFLRSNTQEFPVFNHLIYIDPKEYEKKNKIWEKILEKNPHYKKIQERIEKEDTNMLAFNVNKKAVKEGREMILNGDYPNKIKEIIIKLNKINPV